MLCPSPNGYPPMTKEQLAEYKVKLEKRRLEMEQKERDDLARAVLAVRKAHPKLPHLEKIQQIVDTHQANRVDGVFVDCVSASMILTVYKAIKNEVHKAKFEGMRVRKMFTLACKVL